MNYNYFLLCLLGLGLVFGCQHEKNEASFHDDAHSESHSVGHHTGVLEITSPIRKDTFYYNEYVSQIQAYQHIELKAIEKGYLQKVLVV